jgi:diacylglycerol kinase family enzyme
MDLISTYANGVSELTNFSQSLERAPLIVDVIVNPHAGFFKRRSSLERMILELEQKLAELRKRFPRRKVEINTVHFTERVGHAREITVDIMDKEERAGTGIEHLLIACGGDGTSNEICTALVTAGGSLLDRLKLLRLPLGTGNDVADTPTFGDAYELILGSQHTRKTGALLVAGGASAPRYSFNVASLGLDAFIADLTNRFKRVIPGQAYKALVDVGSLFYEQRVKPEPMDIVIRDGDDETRIDAFFPSMVVVGISGGRTYGGHIPVLPGNENVCVVARMSVLAKIRNKKLFYVGRHGELPEARFFRAGRVDIDYKGTIPMQLDGELFWLEGKDFPLSLRVLEPTIKILTH